MDPQQETELLRQNPCQHALPFFMTIVDEHRASPLHPKALYSAALCHLWMAAPRVLAPTPVWQRWAKQHDGRQKAIALMQRVIDEHPQHDLARAARSFLARQTKR